MNEEADVEESEGEEKANAECSKSMTDFGETFGCGAVGKLVSYNLCTETRHQRTQNTQTKWCVRVDVLIASEDMPFLIAAQRFQSGTPNWINFH